MSEARIQFIKTDRARYISHLDLMRTFQRAFLRADLHVRLTEGFNPHAYVSIALPLSVGFSSQCEILEFGLPEGEDRSQVPERLTRALPEASPSPAATMVGGPSRSCAGSTTSSPWSTTPEPRWGRRTPSEIS